MSASREELLEVNDIGEVIADSITDFFSNESNISMVSGLKEAGLQFEMDTAPSLNATETLKGKTIVISGNFSISRNEMKELIEIHGGKNSGSLSGKTAFLLAGEKPGPEKLKKAESYGIPVISESEFMAMISDGIGNNSETNTEVNPEAGKDQQLSLF